MHTVQVTTRKQKIEIHGKEQNMNFTTHMYKSLFIWHLN